MEEVKILETDLDGSDHKKSESCCGGCMKSMWKIASIMKR